MRACLTTHHGFVVSDKGAPVVNVDEGEGGGEQQVADAASLPSRDGDVIGSSSSSIGICHIATHVIVGVALVPQGVERSEFHAVLEPERDTRGSRGEGAGHELVSRAVQIHGFARSRTLRMRRTLPAVPP